MLNPISINYLTPERMYKLELEVNKVFEIFVFEPAKLKEL